MQYKPKYGWLYLLIALCLAFSGVMIWGLAAKLTGQEESAALYTELSEDAVVAGATVFASPSPTPYAYSIQSEEEAEDQSDTVFFINHDVTVLSATRATLTTATPTPSVLPTPTVTARSAELTASPQPTATVKASAGSTAGLTPIPTATASAGMTAGPTSIPTAIAMASVVTGATAKPIPTATVAAAALATASPVSSPEPTAAGSAEAISAGVFASSATVSGAASPAPSAAADAAFPGLSTAIPALNRFVRMDDVHYSVDFDYLQSINPDVKAWIVQDGTPINYPVLQGKDNDYYLERMFNRKLNKDGSIYLDSGSSSAFNDANTYIYGHHTKTEAMFTTLAEYKNQAYYDAHPQMVLLTPYGDYSVDLFAARVCAVDDEISWRVKQFLSKAEFTDYLKALESQSLFIGHADAMPEWGDQLLVLVTCTNETHGERYVVYGRMRQIVYASDNSVTVTKLAMDQAAMESGWRDVPGRGKMMVYFQNDPIWADMRYETRTSGKRRPFGAGGCGPSSVAMAVANLVPLERLPDIYGYAKTSLGYTFCTCSVNQFFCNKLHAQYQVQQPEEYLRYFPLVMANFATGNNLWDETSRGTNAGTTLNFLKKIAYLYKLDLSVTYDNDETLDAVRNGAIAIVSLSRENPFTGTGHYAVIASVDDSYLYVLDPYLQPNYDKTDKHGLLTRLSEGVVQVKLEDARQLFMSTSYILKTTPQTDSPDPPAVQ